MGCDIHLHIEIKLNGKWEHLNHPNIDRHYGLFTKMAGVRHCDNIAPISEPKGLPKDMSMLTMFNANHWKDDMHSSSWLSAKEIVQLSDWLNTLSTKEAQYDLDLEQDILHCYFFGNSFAGFTKYPEDQKDRISDVRFVFWFDN